MTGAHAESEALSPVQRVLREPLVAFLVLGLGLFILHAWRAPPPAEVITVSQGQILAQHTARLGRTPTPKELAQAIEHETERRALHKEARRLGLDQADPIIERRLVQKMELLAEDLATMEAATESELQAFLRDHAERFTAAQRRDIEHVFVAEGSNTNLRAVTRALKRGASAQTLGQAFPAGRRFKFRTEAEFARTLGPELARAAFEAPVQTWGGPWSSAYGLHWVRTSSVVAAHLPPLDKVTTQVEAEFERERRMQAILHTRQQALSRYTVVIEP